jgi:hypothetical protein
LAEEGDDLSKVEIPKSNAAPKEEKQTQGEKGCLNRSNG